MRKQPETLNHQVQASTLAALLNEGTSPFASHINIPTGASYLSLAESQSVSQAFINTIQSIEGQATSSTFKQNTPVNSTTPPPLTELNFGAPQIDLSLPKGTLNTNAVHEFNPVHFRDQDLAYKSAIALAARQHKAVNSAPIFCFLSEDQTNLISWLSGNGPSEFGLNNQDVIVITAKHSDDLLWAMEETMHTTKASALIAHFTLLDNLSAQRLAFASKSSQTPCLLICNHKIEGPKHCHSQWSIHQAQSDDTTILTLTSSKTNMSGLSWTINWQTDRNRFSAMQATNANSENTGASNLH